MAAYVLLMANDNKDLFCHKAQKLLKYTKKIYLCSKQIKRTIQLVDTSIVLITLLFISILARVHLTSISQWSTVCGKINLNS